MSGYRRYLHPVIALTFAFVIWLALRSGFLHKGELKWWAFPLIGVLLLWLGGSLYYGFGLYLGKKEKVKNRKAYQLGLGLALLGGCALVLHFTGGLTSPFYPLFYLSIAFLSSLGSSRQGATWFIYALLLELAAVLEASTSNTTALSQGALHAVYLAFFAGSHHLYLYFVLRGIQGRRERTTGFRLDDPTTKSQLEREEAGLGGNTASSVKSLEEEKDTLFSLLRVGLEANGCVLLWVDEEDDSYDILHIDSPHSEIEWGPFSLQTGAPANVFRRSGRKATKIFRQGGGGVHIPYYASGTTVHSWLAVPIIKEGAVQGALCIDRVTSRNPFSESEEAILQATALSLERSLNSQESLFSSLRESRNIHRLYEASREVGQATSVEELGNLTLRNASTFVPYDWGFVSLYNEEECNHTIIATTGPIDVLIHQTLPVEDSVMMLALKFGSPLPDKGIPRSPAPLVSSTELELPEHASIFIIPLKLRDKPIGGLVLASKAPQMFADAEREKNLVTLASYLTSLLENFRYRENLGKAALKDSLTGLLNHRYFMEELDKRYPLTKDSNKRFALLLIDVDLLAGINKKHGYATGDYVLSQVADNLRTVARNVDLLARYGSDEFLLLLDGFSPRAALQMADHILSETSHFEFLLHEGDDEYLSLTLSIGVATYPEGGASTVELVHRAEKALLQAKEKGGDYAVLATSPNAGEVAKAIPDVKSLFSQPPPGWGRASVPPVQEKEPWEQPTKVLETSAMMETQDLPEDVSVETISEDEWFNRGLEESPEAFDEDESELVPDLDESSLVEEDLYRTEALPDDLREEFSYSSQSPEEDIQENRRSYPPEEYPSSPPKPAQNKELPELKLPDLRPIDDFQSKDPSKKDK